MKKLFALIMLIGFGTLFLTACTNSKEVFYSKVYNSNDFEIVDVSIDVREREVEVSLSSDNQIHIEYFESDKEFYNISVSDDNVLTMTSDSNKEWSDYIGGKSSVKYRKISLQVPDSLLQSLTITTTNENINLASITANDTVSLSTNGGNIIFDSVNVGRELSLVSKNGNIKGSVIGSYDNFAITCEIKKGESNLPSNKQDGDKSLNVLNNNGDIDIKFVQN